MREAIRIGGRVRFEEYDPAQHGRTGPGARGYQYGFITEIESETAPRGLDENTVRFISSKKEEPDWLLDWRLRA